MERLARPGSPQTVFAEVYGKSLAEVEKDMLSWFRQTHIGGATCKTTASKVEVGPAREATELEIELTLARVVGLPGRVDEACDRLARVVSAHPGNREIEEVQAYLAWRSGDRKRGAGEARTGRRSRCVQLEDVLGLFPLVGPDERRS